MIEKNKQSTSSISLHLYLFILKWICLVYFQPLYNSTMSSFLLTVFLFLCLMHIWLTVSCFCLVCFMFLFLDFSIFTKDKDKVPAVLSSVTACSWVIHASVGQHELKASIGGMSVLCFSYLAWTFVFIRNNIMRIKKIWSSYCHAYVSALHGLNINTDFFKRSGETADCHLIWLDKTVKETSFLNF